MKEKRKVTLLDRAKADLRVAQRNYRMATEETDVDICAYHCQQCIEKAIKYAANISGQEYNKRHDLYLIIEDLDLPDMTPLIEPYVGTLDTWISATRYGESIRSSRKMVEEIIQVCERIIALAESKTPPEISTESDVKNKLNMTSDPYNM